MGLYLPFYLSFAFNPWILPPECRCLWVFWTGIICQVLNWSSVHHILYFHSWSLVLILNPRTEVELCPFELLICTGCVLKFVSYVPNGLYLSFLNYEVRIAISGGTTLFSLVCFEFVSFLLMNLLYLTYWNLSSIKTDNFIKILKKTNNIVQIIWNV